LGEPVFNNGLCNTIKASDRMIKVLFSGVPRDGFKKAVVGISW
jgi:hypothetical protein